LLEQLPQFKRKQVLKTQTENT